MNMRNLLLGLTLLATAGLAAAADKSDYSLYLKAIDRYAEAWSHPKAKRRDEMLKKAVTPNVRYVDDHGAVAGRKALERYIETMRKQTPGLRLEFARPIKARDGFVLAGWRILDAKGAKSLVGVSILRFDATHEISSIDSFFGPIVPN